MTWSIPPLASAAALLLFLATTTTFNPHVDACGVTIHNEVAFRASRILLSTTNETNNSTRLVTPRHQTHSHAPSYSPSVSHPNSIYTSTSLKDDYTPLLEQKDLLFAGSFFPDWGYNCIGKLYNEAAEEVITFTSVHTLRFHSPATHSHGKSEC